MSQSPVAPQKGQKGGKGYPPAPPPENVSRKLWLVLGIMNYAKEIDEIEPRLHFVKPFLKKVQIKVSWELEVWIEEKEELEEQLGNPQRYQLKVPQLHTDSFSSVKPGNLSSEKMFGDWAHC